MLNVPSLHCAVAPAGAVAIAPVAAGIVYPLARHLVDHALYVPAATASAAFAFQAAAQWVIVSACAAVASNAANPARTIMRIVLPSNWMLCNRAALHRWMATSVVLALFVRPVPENWLSRIVHHSAYAPEGHEHGRSCPQIPRRTRVANRATDVAIGAHRRRECEKGERH